MTAATSTRRRRRIASAVLSVCLVAMTAGIGLAMGSGSISGIVFSDPAADGLNDGLAGDTSNPGIAGAMVHLFHDDGLVPASPDALDTEVVGSPFTADSAGRFDLTGLADGDYWVAVDSLSLHATAWPDQTWGPPNSLTNTGTSLAPGFAYSGRTINRSDTMSATGSVSDAEHVTGVTVSGGGAVAGLEFGFSHNVVTNTAGGDITDHAGGLLRTVQGSLRQFIDNANTIAGANDMRFVPVTPALGVSASSTWHQIIVTNQLPTITDASTTVDGTVISPVDGATVLDPNPGGIGEAATTPGFTVGVDAVALPMVARPDLELIGSGGTNNAFVVTGDDAAIQDISLRGFDVAGIQLTAADDATVTRSVIGVAPVDLTDPGAGGRNAMGIQASGGSDGSIINNIVAYNGSVGINFPIAHDDWTMSGNEITSNGMELSWADEIRLVGGDDVMISGNYIHDGNQIGIEIRVDVRSLTVINNTVDGNGAGGNEVAGIREINRGAWPHTIEANIVTNNAGPGVLISQDSTINPPPSLATVTRNSFGGNGRMAIDITLDSADRVWGDGPNPLVAACGTGTGSNEEIDRPVITAATTASTWTRLVGTGCAGSTIELFTAVADADLSDTFSGVDYGEPISYLGSAVVAGDGTFDVFMPSPVSAGTPVTATVTDTSGNTSEQAANTVVAAANIPVITVLGSDPLAVEAGGAYADPGATALDVEDGDLTASLVIVDPVDPFTLGSYVVTYDVTDSDGYPADQATRSVNVVDTTAPVVSLLGSNPMTVEAGTTFVDPGATAADSFEGDLTAGIAVSGLVDTGVLGSYALIYSASDSTGNVGSAVRTVDVVDTGAPTLALLGDNPLIVPQLTTYVEPGAVALDAFEGDISAAVVVGGSVDTSTRGTYVLTYDVADSSGNTAPTQVRQVTVADANPPVITVLGASPVTIEAGSGYTDAGALAFDAEDGELTSEIVVTNLVDDLVPATYVVTYDVADLSGNTDSANRTVTVEDTTPPAITLLGANPHVITVGHQFTDPGATAVDTIDGDLSGSIVVSGIVDVDAIGTYTLTYSVFDSAGNSASVDRVVEVVANQAPVAAADSYTVDEGATLAITAPGVLANDTDPDASSLAPTSALTADLVSGPSEGAVQLGADGSFTYTHDGGPAEADSFTYRAVDAHGAGSVATVSIVIIQINDAPGAADDELFIDEDGSGSVDLLANDSDPDGDALAVTSLGSNPDLTVSVVDGVATITPVADWFGHVVLSYSVSDGALSASAELTVVVSPVNDAPLAVNDQAEIRMGGEATTDVLANDRDADGDALALIGIGEASNGTVRVVGDLLLYQPDDLFIGTDWYDYTISDPSGATATGRVTVVVSTPVLAAGAITSWMPDAAGPTPVPDGGGSTVSGPAASVRSILVVPLVLLADAIVQHLAAFRIPLALLGITALWVVFGYAPWAGRQRRYAVVLLDREEWLVARDKAGHDAETVHKFNSAARQIESTGSVRRVDGERWIQVRVPDGVGWVPAAHLTEDAAKSTFEADMADGRVLERLRSRLAGRSSHGSAALNMGTLTRQAGAPLVDASQREHLLAALSDEDSAILLDRTAAPTSLRPNRLRNFHWATVAPVTGPAWQVLFEYRRGRPRVAGIRLESAAVGA